MTTIIILSLIFLIIDQITKILSGGYDNGFKFNGKKYKLDYGINEVKGNSFPLQCNVAYLQQYFGANIRYDYEKELIYIDF